MGDEAIGTIFRSYTRDWNERELWKVLRNVKSSLEKTLIMKHTSKLLFSVLESLDGMIQRDELVLKDAETTTFQSFLHDLSVLTRKFKLSDEIGGKVRTQVDRELALILELNHKLYLLASSGDLFFKVDKFCKQLVNIISTLGIRPNKLKIEVDKISVGGDILIAAKQNDAAEILDMLENLLGNLPETGMLDMKTECDTLRDMIIEKRTMTTLGPLQILDEIQLVALDVVNAADAKLEELDANIDPEDIEIGEMIGQGAFGEVYAGEYLGQQVAVKRLTEGLRRRDRSRRELELEALRWRNLKHPNIVGSIGTYVMDRSLHIVMMRCETSLHEQLHGANPVKFDLYRITRYARMIFAGLDFLHSVHLMIHRDIKPLNILISGDLVQLSDFGLSLMTVQTTTDTIHLCGTPNYLPPEVLVTPARWVYKADVYSAGIVMWEMVERKIPFRKYAGLIQISQAISKGERPQFTSDNSKSEVKQDSGSSKKKGKPKKNKAKGKSSKGEGPEELEFSAKDLENNSPEWLVKFIKLCWGDSPSQRPFAHQALAFLETKEKIMARTIADNVNDASLMDDDAEPEVYNFEKLRFDIEHQKRLDVKQAPLTSRRRLPSNADRASLAVNQADDTTTTGPRIRSNSIDDYPEGSEEYIAMRKIDTLKNALSDEETLYEACMDIAKMIKSSREMQKFSLTHGASKALLQTLISFSRNGRIQAAVLMNLNILAQYSPNAKKRIIDDGAVNAITTSMGRTYRSELNASVILHGCHCVVELSKYGTTVRDFVERGALSPILNALKQFKQPKMLAAVFNALGFLAFDNNTASLLVRAKTVTYVLEALEMHMEDEKVVRNGLYALSKILFINKTTIPRNEQTEILAIVLKARRSKVSTNSMAIHSYFCTIVAAFGHPETENSLDYQTLWDKAKGLPTDAVLNAVSESLDLFLDEVDVQYWGIEGLRALARDADKRDKVALSGAGERIAKAMWRHKENPDLNRAGGAATLLLSDGGSRHARKTMRQGDLPKALHEAAQTFPEIKIIAQASLDLIEVDEEEEQDEK